MTTDWVKVDERHYQRGRYMVVLSRPEGGWYVLYCAGYLNGGPWQSSQDAMARAEAHQMRDAMRRLGS